MQWMIYGANGYTGRMMVAEAVQRGLHPVLAGRNSAELNALAAQYGLPTRVFALEAGDALKAGLSGIGLVLHVLGHFPPPVRRCWKPASPLARTTSISPAKFRCSRIAMRRICVRARPASW